MFSRISRGEIQQQATSNRCSTTTADRHSQYSHEVDALGDSHEPASACTSAPPPVRLPLRPTPFDRGLSLQSMGFVSMASTDYGDEALDDDDELGSMREVSHATEFGSIREASHVLQETS